MSAWATGAVSSPAAPAPQLLGLGTVVGLVVSSAALTPHNTASVPKMLGLGTVVGSVVSSAALTPHNGAAPRTWSAGAISGPAPAPQLLGLGTVVGLTVASAALTPHGASAPVLSGAGTVQAYRVSTAVLSGARSAVVLRGAGVALASTVGATALHAVPPPHGMVGLPSSSPLSTSTALMTGGDSSLGGQHSRAMQSSTSTALDHSELVWSYIVRLDITGDPILGWTGYGPLAFAAGATGDAALDGLSFDGLTHMIGSIGAIGDGQGGSQALELMLPGIDLRDEALRQVVYNQATWQFRQAWVWMVLTDEATGTVIGRPVRLKTGRIDTMEVMEATDGTGTVRCVIESQQAYAGEALNTRYSEQVDINPTDTSQNWVWQLANFTPAFGQANSIAAASVSVPSYSGGYGPGSGGITGLNFNRF